MLHIKRMVFSPFQENTYIVYDETGECVIIDPGMISESENNKLAEEIDSHNLKPMRVLLTHMHLDHVFGCFFVYEKYGLLPEGHVNDEIFLDNTVDLAIHYGIELSDSPPKLGKCLNENDKVSFGNTILDIIHVPGHSPGSILYYHPESKTLISGDVLFYQSIGRSDLPGGNHAQLINGINEKLMTLPDDVKVYPGHGPETTIGMEKKGNPFL